MNERDFINARQIDAKKPGPHILLTAGVHGDEYEPMLVALDLINDLPSILQHGTVTIVPITNESAYFNSSRFGEDTLDLARVCPGHQNGTATEKAASHISTLIKKADYFIDMHTGGLAYDIYPLAGYMLHPSPKVLKTQQEMALACQLPLVWGTDYRPDGRTLSIARDANIPAIYLEYGGGTGIRKNVIEAYKNSVLSILRHFNMISSSDKTASYTEKFWIEDHRKDSGYLQGKMPSPADGIFLPEVNVGDKVKKSQLFGRVIEPSSGKSNSIYADKAGLVFLLRTIVKVKSGDALGGIIPVKLGKKEVYE